MRATLFYLTAREGREEAFHDLAVRLTEITRSEDDGCLVYTFHQRVDNPREYVLYEQWRDAQALGAHLAHLQALYGPPRPGEILPAAFLDLCEPREAVAYEVVACVRQRRDWAFITRPNNWQICLERHAFGFDAEYRETVSRYMAPGDRALVYVTAPVKGIVGALRIDRVSLDETADFGWTAASGQPKLFPDRVYWTPIKMFNPPLAIGAGSEFFNRLQFIPDKRRYNVYLQVALIRIPAEDLELALSWGQGHGS